MTPQEIYNKFKNKQGSKYIAEVVSISNVMELCKGGDIVLELGAGIGTLTYAMIQKGAFVYTYESNKFCIEELRKNLAEYDFHYNLIESYKTLPPQENYALIVVDGGTGNRSDQDDGTMRTISLFLQSLDDIKIIYVEGNRVGQRAFICNALRNRYTYKVTRYPSSLKKSRGGTKYVCKKNKSRLARWVCWLINK